MPRVRQQSTQSNLAFGLELELGDVERRLVIPTHLGAWESAECDIVNLSTPHRWVAADPLGQNPPVGGEVNTIPTRTIQEQVEKVGNLFSWLKGKKQVPTSSCLSHTHVHVSVQGLLNDVPGLKRLTRYIIENQTDSLKHCHQFNEQTMAGGKLGKTYLKWDCGRPMPEWMGENIINHAKTFEDFIRLQCCGKDAVSMGRPFRYAINTYCLKHYHG